jgi:large conductance mechanosensitive channel
MKEFVAFLKQYGVIGLAIAVIIGGKLNDLIKTVVDGLLMPLVGMFNTNTDWRQFSFTLNGSKFLYGPVIGSLIDFVIVAGLVFLIAKFVLKEDTVAKR